MPVSMMMPLAGSSEKVSGKSYEQYIRQHVLQPVGARDTRVGRTLLADRLPREVWYDAGGQTGLAILGPQRGKPVSMAYGAWPVEVLDSHGGLVATAPDLVRFAMEFDHPERCKLLKARSIESMFAPPPGPAGRARRRRTWAAHPSRPRRRRAGPDP